MELPNDIWNEIVKNSITTVQDYKDKLDINGINRLMNEMKQRKQKLIKERKSQFGKNYIVIFEGKYWVITNMFSNKIENTNVQISRLYKCETYYEYGYYTANTYEQKVNVFDILLYKTHSQVLLPVKEYVKTLKTFDRIRYVVYSADGENNYFNGNVASITKNHIITDHRVKVHKNNILLN
jgi:hypothetical protein